ncbi:hypothetical protein TA3x_000425 [Tundrisphaera sp. TA3]|uniref:hypothetical protein n=1 Tax=Tundrisphaera sp. TA3 TaxID=3435775 RepID=UPI003EBCF56C
MGQQQSQAVNFVYKMPDGTKVPAIDVLLNLDSLPAYQAKRDTSSGKSRVAKKLADFRRVWAGISAKKPGEPFSYEEWLEHRFHNHSPYFDAVADTASMVWSCGNRLINQDLESVRVRVRLHREYERPHPIQIHYKFDVEVDGTFFDYSEPCAISLSSAEMERLTGLYVKWEVEQGYHFADYAARGFRT